MQNDTCRSQSCWLMLTSFFACVVQSIYVKNGWFRSAKMIVWWEGAIAIPSTVYLK